MNLPVRLEPGASAEQAKAGASLGEKLADVFRQYGLGVMSGLIQLEPNGTMFVTLCAYGNIHARPLGTKSVPALTIDATDEVEA